MCRSAYIHIPFCKSKCKYCSFVSGTNINGVEKYIYALLSEIDYFYKGEVQNTIYFGGGTPSVLAPKYINKVLKNFKYNSDTEITFEINPDDANADYLSELRAIGINRLSFGSQTFNDNILKYIGRRHDSNAILKAVEYARKTKFDNISLDLMYGLPNQDIKFMEHDLNIIKELDINHVSTYGLKIEEPSYFSYNMPENLPDNDTQADMYLIINEMLEKAGYKRYEISNFAIKGYESRHNMNYWNNEEYYGFGLSAHGYVNKIRYSNKTNFAEYINNPIEKELNHKVTLKEQIEEEIFLGLRKEEGINLDNFKQKYGFNFEEKYNKIITKYSNYFVKTDVGCKFTLEGVLLSNEILPDFIDD